MLLGNPVVCRVPRLYICWLVGSLAPATGRPVPQGQAVPVVSTK